MNKTKIPWADFTWNPVSGCSPVSEGCEHCYAEKMARRFTKGSGIENGVGREYFKVTLHPDRLDEPLCLKKPARIFVCSMSDLFHPDVPVSFIAKILDRMASRTTNCNHRKYESHEEECWTGDFHTFLVLTKRIERAKKLIEEELPYYAAEYMPGDCCLATAMEDGEWPLPNVWLGVTAENQARADERIPILLQTPAAKRFVSIEPMLQGIDLSRWLMVRDPGVGAPRWELSRSSDGVAKSLLDWVIVGGESGHGARPCSEEWVQSVYDQCQAAGVPFFFKAAGSNWIPRCDQGDIKTADCMTCIGLNCTYGTAHWEKRKERPR